MSQCSFFRLLSEVGRKWHFWILTDLLTGLSSLSLVRGLKQLLQCFTIIASVRANWLLFLYDDSYFDTLKFFLFSLSNFDMSTILTNFEGRHMTFVLWQHFWPILKVGTRHLWSYSRSAPDDLPQSSLFFDGNLFVKLTQPCES